jgi:hypothetical protein
VNLVLGGGSERDGPNLILVSPRGGAQTGRDHLPRCGVILALDSIIKVVDVMC